MKKSTDVKSQHYLENLQMENPAKYLIVQHIREVIFSIYPNTNERMMYGGILFSLNEDYGGVFVYKHHVSLEFGYGYHFDDPENLLAGGGKFRRHLKIKTLEDIESKKVDFFVKQVDKFQN